MTSQVAQVAGYNLNKTTSLTLSVQDAITHATNSGTALENMLELLEPKQIVNNEIVNDSYQECLQLKDYLSEQLWSDTEADGVVEVQNALDIVTRAIVSYEMMKDAAEGDWELVDVCIPSL
ncbi:uncharacterized protein BX664DRAFT_337626 [Halteromyces radiatus]|uniref:uncharacterized protein n=1 Tax=Halteromyces radiatus TaxID=101107 RepID=UPI00221EDCA9|nr:uncharacterized protein BX664DRAFT_337626 [Halteromyces radiatus]KAI8084724.1 hypothetical protein BX664DRAFT_337626 [Halteromyces radiatus]